MFNNFKNYIYKYTTEPYTKVTTEQLGELVKENNITQLRKQIKYASKEEINRAYGNWAPETLLAYAIKLGHNECAQILLNHPAIDVTAHNYSAFSSALEYSNVNIAYQLIKHPHLDVKEIAKVLGKKGLDRALMDTFTTAMGPLFSPIDNSSVFYLSENDKVYYLYLAKTLQAIREIQEINFQEINITFNEILNKIPQFQSLLKRLPYIYLPYLSDLITSPLEGKEIFRIVQLAMKANIANQQFASIVTSANKEFFEQSNHLDTILSICEESGKNIFPLLRISKENNFFKGDIFKSYFLKTYVSKIPYEHACELWNTLENTLSHDYKTGNALTAIRIFSNNYSNHIAVKWFDKTILSISQKEMDKQVQSSYIYCTISCIELSNFYKNIASLLNHFDQTLSEEAKKTLAPMISLVKTLDNIDFTTQDTAPIGNSQLIQNEIDNFQKEIENIKRNSTYYLSAIMLLNNQPINFGNTLNNVTNLKLKDFIQLTKFVHNAGFSLHKVLEEPEVLLAHSHLAKAISSKTSTDKQVLIR